MREQVKTRTGAEIDAEIAALEARVAELEGALEPYRWRPIEEIHEDCGPCLLIDLDDPGGMELGSSLDLGFNETMWTHFAEAPKLTHEEAERLRAARARGGKK